MWTTVGLTGGQFFGILLLSILLFLLLDGPAWHHLHDSHTRRILGSYGVIPPGFYTTYGLVAGLMLGTMGALNSFLFNVVGSFLASSF